MTGKTYIVCLIALGMFMSMCTARKSSTQSFPTPAPKNEPIYATQPATPASMGYKGGMETAFYYTEGIKISELRNDRVKAARYFDMAIETDPAHSPSYFAAANNIAPLDPGLALEYSRKANSLDTANIWYQTQLGRLLVMNGMYAEATDIYTSLIGKDPHNPENFRMLAALYEVGGEPYMAVALLDSAESKFGMLAEISEYKRELYIKLRLYDQAINLSQRLAAEYPYDYRNHLVTGQLYLAKGKDSLGLASLNKALEMSPDSIEVLMSLASYYRAGEDNDNFFAVTKKIFQSDMVSLQAKTAMFSEITRDLKFYAENYMPVLGLATTLRIKYPNNYEVLELSAGSLFAGGSTEEALNLYKKYISDTTSFVEPYNVILEAEAYLGRVDSVNKYSLMAIGKFPDDPELHIRRGSALAYMKQEKQALKSYETALKAAGSDSLRSVIYGCIGDLYHQTDKTNKSFHNYEKALTLYPDNTLVLNNYAYYLSLKGQELDKALRMAARVMELEPGNSTYIDTYGWVLYKMGRFEEAKKALQQAVSLDQHASKELLVHYGDVLYELGDHFMAKYYWEKALAAGYDKEDIEKRMDKLGGK